MQFKKQSSGRRSPRRLVAHRGVTITSLSPWILSPSAPTAFAGPHAHCFEPIGPRRIEEVGSGEGGSIRIQPEPDKSWRIISAAIFGLSARLVGGFAVCGEFAFSGLLLAFMSWTIAQALAGCAAYGRAMHPWVIEDEPRQVRRADPFPGGANAEAPTRHGDRGE
jgi:hypothetical protein